MTPAIFVDDEVYAWLQARAEPFVDSPNSVIRRELGLPPSKEEVDRDFSEEGSGRIDLVYSASGASDGQGERAGRSSRSMSRGSKGRTPRRKRAPKGAALPDTEYHVPLLEVLDELGGRAGTTEVLKALEPRLEGKLKEIDKELLASGIVRWRSRVQFARLNLIQSGDMVKDSPRGIWEISDHGRRRLAGVKG